MIYHWLAKQQVWCGPWKTKNKTSRYHGKQLPCYTVIRWLTSLMLGSGLKAIKIHWKQQQGYDKNQNRLVLENYYFCDAQSILIEHSRNKKYALFMHLTRWANWGDFSQQQTIWQFFKIRFWSREIILKKGRVQVLNPGILVRWSMIFGDHKIHTCLGSSVIYWSYMIMKIEK